MATKKEKAAPKAKKATKKEEVVVEETQATVQEVKPRGWWTLEEFTANKK